ncbi:MAG: acyltransferase family protein [Asticcacaulis sp.]
MSDPTVDFLRGVPSFFEGALVFYAVQALRRHETWRRRAVLALAAILPALWVLSYLRGFQPINTLVAPGIVNGLLSVVTFLYVLMPLTLLALGLMQDHWPGLDSLHKVSWIGDISYSIYLIHFPLQLVVMLALAHLPFVMRAHILALPWALLGFIAVAAGLAWLSFHFFEMPLRRYLSQRMRPLVSRAAAE